MAGCSDAGKEIEHRVAGAAGLGEQALEERNWFCVVESAMAKNFGNLLRALLVGGRHQTVVRFVSAFFKSRDDPAAHGLGLVAQVGFVALELRATKANRFANPLLQIGQIAPQYRRFAAFRHITSVNRSKQLLHAGPCDNTLLFGKQNLPQTNELVHAFGLQGLTRFESGFAGVNPDTVRVGRVMDAGGFVHQGLIKIWAFPEGKPQGQVLVANLRVDRCPRCHTCRSFFRTH